MLAALEHLRSEAEAEIERLIDILDRTDLFFDEREHQVDDDPIDGDDDSEDSLGSVDGNQTRWAAGDASDREGDDGCDDREGDELQHGGDEHDGREPGEDDEPILGWPENVTQGINHGGWNDYEVSGSEVTEARRARYRKGKANRYATNKDGRHLDSERGFCG